MRKIYIYLSVLFFTCIAHGAKAQQADGRTDREYWVAEMCRIANPVLTNLSQGTLKKNMPVETQAGSAAPPNYKTTHLEALGRLLAGIAPWLELGADDTPEGRLRGQYIALTTKAIANAFDPASPDYMNFVLTRQPLVDAAFFCQGLLRAPTQVWGRLPEGVKRNVMAAMDSIRRIEPVESNWLLFSAMVEAAMLEFRDEWDQAPVDYAMMRFGEWYKGDGWYGDGPALHIDYYNSYVIHPMLLDILSAAHRHGKADKELYELEKIRFTRYAEQLERIISPDGAYPVFGRSIAYRFGAFHALSQSALAGLCPENLSKGQIRSALTAVIKRHMSEDGNLDPDGWLTLGFCGHQKDIAERYISTGSLYLCTTVFVALGLSPADEFWTAPYADWSSKKIWGGDPAATLDKAIRN